MARESSRNSLIWSLQRHQNQTEFQWTKKKVSVFFLRRFFSSKRSIICHVVYFPKAPKCLLFSYVLTPCPHRVRHEKHRLEAQHMRIFPREEKFVERSVTCRERICKILRPRILCASETAGCYAVRWVVQATGYCRKEACFLCFLESTCQDPAWGRKCCSLILGFRYSDLINVSSQ